MRVQLVYNIKHPIPGPQALVQIDECDPQDILMAGHWHDAAFNIGQQFFRAHCNVNGTCVNETISVNWGRGCDFQILSQDGEVLRVLRSNVLQGRGSQARHLLVTCLSVFEH